MSTRKNYSISNKLKHTKKYTAQQQKQLIKHKSIKTEDIPINIDYKNKYITLLINLLQTQNDLIIKYYDFWQNIYYNDTYVFYKNAIMFLKNQQNSKFHGFFGAFINKILWNGQCDYMATENPDWISKNSLRQPEPSALCKVGIEVIRNLDEMFKSICPKLNNHLTVYRMEWLPLNLENTQKLIKSNSGDLLKLNNYVATTISYNYSPLGFCGCSKKINDDDTEKEKKEKDNPNACELCDNKLPILYIMELPENTTGFYYNIPFAPLPFMVDRSGSKKNGIYIGHNEYEFVLPRGCIFEIISNKIDFTKTRRIIHIKLIKQLKEYPIVKEGENINDLIKVFNKDDKLPKEYNNSIELNKYHDKYYQINNAVYDYMLDNYNILLFNNKLEKVLSCKTLKDIKEKKHKSLLPFYKSLQKPNLRTKLKYYLCLFYYEPAPEIFMKLHTINVNDEITMPKYFSYVISSDLSFALLNSLILYNFYKETTGKNNNNIKVAEHFSKLVNDMQLFYLIELINLESYKENFYKINNNISVLATVNKELDIKLCEPNNSYFMSPKDWKDCKLVIKSTNINSISNFKYKHIKCDLKILFI